MDSRGGCCIARYAPGAYDMSKVDRIMLRFRPIAPKPVAGATTTSDGSSSESSGTFSKVVARTKRKYVRDKNNSSSNTNNRRRRRKKTTSSPENNRPAAPVVTLPLLPETPDPKEERNNNNNNNNNNNTNSNNMNRNVPVLLSFENRGSDPYWYGGESEHAAARVIGTASYSCATVECVTDTWGEGEGLLGRNDEERRVKLGDDTCPGFISDGYGRVTWTNGAYREMVGQEGEGALLVLLVVKVGVVVPNYPCCSFTCRVRVAQYECGKERSSLTLPCDVCRMDSGGFAWRLDLKAALTLRLLSC